MLIGANGFLNPHDVFHRALAESLSRGVNLTSIRVISSSIGLPLDLPHLRGFISKPGQNSHLFANQSSSSLVVPHSSPSRLNVVTIVQGAALPDLKIITSAGRIFLMSTVASSRVKFPSTKSFRKSAPLCCCCLQSSH